MKKFSLLFMGLILLCSYSGAQTITDFNSGITGWEKSSDSNYGIDSLYQTIDPSNSALKCLGIHFTFHNAIADTTKNLHGRIDYGTIGTSTYLPTNGALYMTYWVYLDSAQHIPDSLVLTTYTMDNKNWGWNDHLDTVKNIPKNVWYPLQYPLGERAIANPGVLTGSIMFGMQFEPKHPDWNGVIYIQKVQWIGAKPTVVSDFNSSISGWEKSSDSNYGLDSLFSTKDPAVSTEKCMGIHFTFHNAIADTTKGLHGRIDYGTIGNSTYLPLGTYQDMVYWIYLDTLQNIPDSLGLTTYTMDNKNWGWNDHIFVAKDIPKNVWYPLPYPLAARATANAGILTGNTMFGMQFQPAHPDWNGIIYIKKVALANEVLALPPTWNASDFEDSKLHNFHVPSYGTGVLSVVPDMKTNNGSNVLQDAVDLSSAPHKLAVVRDGVPMQWNKDSTATSVSFDMYLPTTGKAPNGGIVKFFVSGGTGDSLAIVDTIGKQITSGWVTLTIGHLDSLATLGKFDPSKNASIGVILSYPNDTSTWKGNVWFDNLVIAGDYNTAQLITGVKNTIGVVKSFELYNNYPNPFNPTTNIKYDVAQNSKVQIIVFDILGREVATLVNEQKGAGSYVVEFNASKLTSSVYFIRMTAGSFTKTQKMMLIK